MPRQKKRPSIDSQLRNLIATATEEKLYTLAQKLIEILKDLERPAVGLTSGGGEA